RCLFAHLELVAGQLADELVNLSRVRSLLRLPAQKIDETGIVGGNFGFAQHSLVSVNGLIRRVEPCLSPSKGRQCEPRKDTNKQLGMRHDLILLGTRSRIRLSARMTIWEFPG